MGLKEREQQKRDSLLVPEVEWCTGMMLSLFFWFLLLKYDIIHTIIEQVQFIK